jgi:hypothetical protein
MIPIKNGLVKNKLEEDEELEENDLKKMNDDKRQTKLLSITYDSYWSSTEYADNTSNAWKGYFNNGYMFNTNKSYEYFHTICIHD